MKAVEDGWMNWNYSSVEHVTEDDIALVIFPGWAPGKAN